MAIIQRLKKELNYFKKLAEVLSKELLSLVGEDWKEKLDIAAKVGSAEVPDQKKKKKAPPTPSAPSTPQPSSNGMAPTTPMRDNNKADLPEALNLPPESPTSSTPPSPRERKGSDLEKFADDAEALAMLKYELKQVRESKDLIIQKLQEELKHASTSSDNDRLAELEVALKEKEEEKHNALQSSQHDHARLEFSLKELQLEQEELQSKLDAERRQTKIFHERAQKLLNERDELQDKMSLLSTEYDQKLQSLQETHRTEIRGLKARMNDLRMLTNSKDGEALDELDKQMDDVNLTDLEPEELRKQLSDARNRIGSLEASLEATVQELFQATSTSPSADTPTVGVKKNLEDKHLQSVKNTLADYEEQLQYTKEKFEKSQGEIQQLKLQHLDKNREVKELRSKLEEMELKQQESELLQLSYDNQSKLLSTQRDWLVRVEADVEILQKEKADLQHGKLVACAVADI